MAASSWTMAMRRGMVDPGLSPWKGGENKSALNIAHYSSAPPELRRIAIFLPQFFGSLSFLPPGGALFGRFNTGHGPTRALQKRIRIWKLQAAGSGGVRSSSIFSAPCSPPSVSPSLGPTLDLPL